MKWLSLSLFFGVSSALAQESELSPLPEESVVSSPLPSLEISTDLHREYLLGEPMLVRIDVVNAGEGSRSFSDLSAEPWRVRFKVTPEGGRAQTRYNLPNEGEESRNLTLSPRSRKQVLLEIPSSKTYRAGRYTLEIEIQGEQETHQIPKHSFRIASANPVAGQISYEPLVTERGGHQVVWGHETEEGMGVYLNHSSAANPANVFGNYHLLHVEEPVEPRLARSAPQQFWDRHIYWMRSKTSLSYARLRGHALRGAPLSLNFPYPEVELMALGATDKDGTFHVPFWVSAPNGEGGELRIASVDARSRPSFRSVWRTASKPEWVESLVDPTGNLRLLVGQEGSLDIYTLSSDTELPAQGRRIFGSEGNVLYAQLSQLPESASFGGGLVLGVLRRVADPELFRVAVSWLSLEGQELMNSEPVSLAEGSSIEQVLIANGSFWVLSKDSRNRFWLQGSSTEPVVVSLEDKGTIVPLLGGSGVSLRRLKRGVAVQSSTP